MPVSAYAETAWTRWRLGWREPTALDLISGPLHAQGRTAQPSQTSIAPDGHTRMSVWPCTRSRLCHDARMRVIAFVTQKGGSGKTALATSCAVAAEQAGHKSLILDMDPQASAEVWYQDREAKTPHLARVGSPDLDSALKKAKAAGFQIVMIDTPGRDDPATTAAIRVADL